MSTVRTQQEEIKFPDDQTTRKDVTGEETTGGDVDAASDEATVATAWQRSPVVEIIVDLVAKVEYESYLCVQIYSGKPHLISCGGEASRGGETSGGGRQKSPLVEIIVDLTSKLNNDSYLCVQLYSGKPPFLYGGKETGGQRSPVVQIMVDLAAKYD